MTALDIELPRIIVGDRALQDRLRAVPFGTYFLDYERESLEQWDGTTWVRRGRGKPAVPGQTKEIKFGRLGIEGGPADAEIGGGNEAAADVRSGGGVGLMPSGLGGGASTGGGTAIGAAHIAGDPLVAGAGSEFTIVGENVLIAAVDPGAIGANKLWFDSATRILFIRNAVNAGWEVLSGFLGAKMLGSVPVATDGLNTPFTVALNSTPIDSGGFADLAGDRIVIQNAGKYRLTASAEVITGAAGVDEWTLWLLLNGANINYGYGYTGFAGGAIIAARVVAETIITCAVGDVITATIQNSNTASTATAFQLTATLIGA